MTKYILFFKIMSRLSLSLLQQKNRNIWNNQGNSILNPKLPGLPFPPFLSLHIGEKGMIRKRKIKPINYCLLHKGLRWNYFWQAPSGRPEDSTIPSKNISYKKRYKEIYSKSKTTKLGYLLCARYQANQFTFCYFIKRVLLLKMFKR